MEVLNIHEGLCSMELVNNNGVKQHFYNFLLYKIGQKFLFKQFLTGYR